MPTIPGYRVKRVIGIVSGITPRTRGILGNFIAGIESMIGGEVTAFSYEIEKARAEAIDRVRAKAVAMGANAVLSVDIETSDIVTRWEYSSSQLRAPPSSWSRRLNPELASFLFDI